MLGKQMPGIGIEQLLDKSLVGAFLMRTYRAEERIVLEDTAEHAQKNVRSYLMTHGKLLDVETLGEHAQIAAMLDATETTNPAIVLVNYGSANGRTEVQVRAYAKEGMQKTHSAERVIERMQNYLTGTDGVLDAILKEFDL